MQQLIMGVDEAGRGPVIGSMVIAGVMIKEDDLHKLDNIGLKDSKLLSPKVRETLYSTITELDYLKYTYNIIEPKEIDECLNSVNMNLNSLEALHTSMLINKLKPDKAILDLPTNNAEKYNKMIKLNLNIDCNLTSEHKADANYPIVSAASIIAKVIRDREIEKIKNKIGFNLGSGYPSDPRTVEFLKKNYNKYPDIFRKTWQSYKKVAFSKKQSKLNGF